MNSTALAHSRPGSAIREFPPDLLDTLKLTEKGVVRNLSSNLVSIFNHCLADCLRFNELTQQVEYNGKSVCDGNYSELQTWLSTHFTLSTDFSIAMIDQKIRDLSKRDSYNPIIEMIEECPWDGIPRLGVFLRAGDDAEYIEVSETHSSAYLHFVIKALFVGAIARVYKPGCKLDTMPIFEGLQGLKKSTMLQSLALGHFLDNMPFGSNGENSKDTIISTQGKWFAEIQEVDKELIKNSDGLKKFLGRQIDTVRMPYERNAVDLPRRFIVIGTTNQNEYFTDSTGNRRYLPVKVLSVDQARIERDALQLWAEAKVWFDRGEKWWSDADTDFILEEQKSRKMLDPWVDLILETIEKHNLLTTVEEVEDFKRIKKEAGITWFEGVNRGDLCPSARLIPLITYESIKGLNADLQVGFNMKDSRRFSHAMAFLGFEQRQPKFKKKNGRNDPIRAYLEREKSKKLNAASSSKV